MRTPGHSRPRLSPVFSINKICRVLRIQTWAWINGSFLKAPSILVLLSWTLIGNLGHAAARPRLPVAPVSQPPVALITGSDRGIGFALTQELVARGWKVIATCREPPHAQALQEFAASHPAVTIDALDVANTEAIDVLAAKYHGQPIDVLINNAGLGILSLPSAAALSAEEFQRVILVNTFAPLRVSGAFLEQVAASRQRKIIAISSGLGSIWLAPQASSQAYAYAVSKAGLNMAMRLLQNEVRDRGIVIGIVSPGPVDTDMQRAYRDAAAQVGSPITAPQLSAADSAKGLANYIESMGAEKAGRFYSYTGQEIPW
jgi:NAD(P)-dependent dehydrogenase (short-subunit alcohol dehydrogenase family)